MAFEMSIVGFFAFLGRPFTNPIGWILLAGAGVIIWLRVTGKIGGIGGNKKGKEGGRQADYVIK